MMHEGEVWVEIDQVPRLVAAQFPQWAGMPLRELPASRRDFREALGCDEETWQRGRGWALSTALVSLPYYWDTAPHIVAENERRIAAVLED